MKSLECIDVERLVLYIENDSIILGWYQVLTSPAVLDKALPLLQLAPVV